MKQSIFIGLILIAVLLSGCVTPNVMPENPASCEQDSDCVAIIHPAGTKMCVGQKWMEMGGSGIVQVNEANDCECVEMMSAGEEETVGEITGGISSLFPEKVCMKKRK